MVDLLRAWLFPSWCAGCDAPGPALCATCAPQPADAIVFALDGIPAYAVGAYEGALRTAVVAMKGGERDPLTPFVRLLASAPVDGTLVPVPTTGRRVADRGFDQSVVLARRLAAARGLRCADLLKKRGGPQAGLGRRARLDSTGRFRLRPNPAMPAEVTLLDDVCTTGATLRDAAGVLAAAGVSVRRIVVIARAAGTPAASAWS